MPRGTPARRSAPARALLAALTVVVGASPGLAGVSFLGGTARYRHTLEVGGATFNSSDSGIPVESNLSSVGFTINSTQTFGADGAQSVGKARIGYIANATTASIALKPGSGVTQTDPAAAPSHSFSEVRIDLQDATALRWDATSPGFGLPSTRYASFTVGGTVGAGGFARFFVNLAWYKNSISGLNSLGSVVLDTGTITTAGPFSRTLTASSSLSGTTLPTGTDIVMIGTILFHADNHGGPTDIFPIDSAIGYSNSGDVATFIGNPISEWFLPDAWSANNNFAEPPNEIGDRAYLPNDQGIPRTITAPQPITLGVLESSGSSTTLIQSLAPNAILNLENASPYPAMVWQRNLNGPAALQLNIPILLQSETTVFENDSTAPIVAGATLSTGSVNRTLVKEGAGPLVLSGPLIHPAGAEYVLNRGRTDFDADPTGPGLQVNVVVKAGLGATDAQARFSVPARMAGLVVGPRGAVTLNAFGQNASATRDLQVQIEPTGFAQLDVTDDGLAIRPLMGDPDPYARVRFLIQSGYAGGAWNGEGIASSVAAVRTDAGVGYARVADLAGLVSFMGQVVDADDVVLRYTLYGDANLNGIVNIADFAALASHFNLAGDWVDGDFNFDGTIGIADFSRLAANFNRSVPVAPPRPAGVPEPGTPLAGLATAAVLATGRRDADR